MAMVARGARDSQNEYFMLPSRGPGGARNKFAAAKGQGGAGMPPGMYASANWSSGGVQLPALGDSHHHHLSPATFNDSLLESVAINHNRPATTQYSPPPPGGKFFTPMASFPGNQMRVAAGGSRGGGEVREAMGAGFYRPRTVAKPGEFPPGKRAPLRPQTQPHGMTQLHHLQQHGSKVRPPPLGTPPPVPWFCLRLCVNKPPPPLPNTTPTPGAMTERLDLATPSLAGAVHCIGA